MLFKFYSRHITFYTWVRVFTDFSKAVLDFHILFMSLAKIRNYTIVVSQILYFWKKNSWSKHHVLENIYSEYIAMLQVVEGRKVPTCVLIRDVMSLDVYSDVTWWCDVLGLQITLRNNIQTREHSIAMHWMWCYIGITNTQY